MKNGIRFYAYLTILASGTAFSQQKTVTLDYCFNNEHQKNAQGVWERYHYTWEDKTLNGYSVWGNLFTSKGAMIKSLDTAPTPANLKGTDVYIITDPDTEKETLHPTYMTEAYAAIIADWVKQGGVLVMMANDSANAELHHFNTLADKFGIHFTDKVRNTVLKDISVGKIMVPQHHEIFKTARQLYLKGISTLTVQQNAKAVIEDKGDIIMAMARYGKGTVFAVGDPWIYNEYIVNDRLSPEFQNGIAAEEFTDWLLKQVPARNAGK